jgi:hypothetical protein
MYGRLSVLPDQAQPLQRSALMAAVSVGTQIIQLRRICSRFDLSLGLDAALEAVAGSREAIAQWRPPSWQSWNRAHLRFGRSRASGARPHSRDL